jgi:hypothetical protein
VIARLLLSDPTDRYPNAQAVIVALCEAAGQPTPTEAPADRESYLSAAPFIGRDHELSTLSAALDLEDHVQTKRCGPRPAKELVAAGEMSGRLRAAVGARPDG